MRSNSQIVSMSAIAMASLVFFGDFQQAVAQRSTSPYPVDELAQHSHLSSTTRGTQTRNQTRPKPRFDST